MPSRKTTDNGLKLLDKWFVEGNPEMQALLDEERKNASIAREILCLREEAGLSQRELAKLAKTSASVICQLEDADYEGHSLSMLRRIAAALGQTVEVHFLPIPMKKPRGTVPGRVVAQRKSRKAQSTAKVVKQKPKTAARASSRRKAG